MIDKNTYRYQKFLSDVSGFDIFYHDNNPTKLIKCVRNWIQTESMLKYIPDSNFISERYKKFIKSFSGFTKSFQRNKPKELTFIDIQNSIME